MGQEEHRRLHGGFGLWEEGAAGPTPLPDPFAFVTILTLELKLARKPTPFNDLHNRTLNMNTSRCHPTAGSISKDLLRALGMKKLTFHQFRPGDL
jgi:hypothetical protein